MVSRAAQPKTVAVQEGPSNRVPLSPQISSEHPVWATGQVQTALRKVNGPTLLQSRTLMFQQCPLLQITAVLPRDGWEQQCMSMGKAGESQRGGGLPGEHR